MRRAWPQLASSLRGPPPCASGQGLRAADHPNTLYEQRLRTLPAKVRLHRFGAASPQERFNAAGSSAPLFGTNRLRRPDSAVRGPPDQRPLNQARCPRYSRLQGVVRQSAALRFRPGTPGRGPAPGHLAAISCANDIKIRQTGFDGYLDAAFALFTEGPVGLRRILVGDPLRPAGSRKLKRVSAGTRGLVGCLSASGPAGSVEPTKAWGRDGPGLLQWGL